MLSQNDYIRYSLEFNLFFLRIMKEHLIFAAAGLPPKNKSLILQLESMKDQFETLLTEAVLLSNGIISPEVKNSGELVTPFTLKAEKVTEYYTGINIDTRITIAEAALNTGAGFAANPAMLQQVGMLNQKAIMLTMMVVQAKAMLLKAASECVIFSHLYPTLIKHVLEEAEMYLRMLQELQMNKVYYSPAEIAGHEVFWNHIMEEHAQFIRGMLDPSEEKLIEKADDFAEEFDELTGKAKEAMEQLALLPKVTGESMKAVKEIRSFKAEGTKGILECKIKSVILPLLSDHVLREASYYLRLLSGIPQK